MQPTKILLAAPAPQLTHWRTSLLPSSSLSFLTAGDSDEALVLARSEQPRLAVIDYRLEPENGPSLCRRLRSYHWLKDLPVIMLIPDSIEGPQDPLRQWECQKTLPSSATSVMLLDAILEILALRPLISRAPRVPQRLPLRFARTEKLNHRGFTLDLSTGGLYLQTDTLYTTGTQMHIEFILPGTLQPLRGRARVAWTNHIHAVSKPLYPQGMGLQFTDLDAQWSQAIAAFVRESV